MNRNVKSRIKTESIQQSLLRWYDQNKRDLPWRFKKTNPYKTWISEIMLQQTQVETVLPYYFRFLKAYPTVMALAKAPLEEVLALWSGLGYYSRARNLHKTAQIIVSERRGKFPKTRDELIKLPGIGEYTAGAIASIAFEERVPIVDGNVIRLLTRIFALEGDPKAKPLKEMLWTIAAKLLPEERIGDFNQSLMELGALVCSSEEPHCNSCPLQTFCKAYQNKEVEKYPTPKENAPTIHVLLAAALIRRGDSYLLAKRGEAKHLQSMWEFPQIEIKDPRLSAKQVERQIQKRWEMEVGIKGTLPIIKHSIMNRRIQLLPYMCHYKKGRPKIGKEYKAYRWITPEELEDFPTSSLNHKIIVSI